MKKALFQFHLEIIDIIYYITIFYEFITSSCLSLVECLKRPIHRDIFNFRSSIQTHIVDIAQS